MINFIKGFIIGIGKIIPGVSGGMQTNTLNLKQKNDINEISTIQKMFTSFFYYLYY